MKLETVIRAGNARGTALRVGFSPSPPSDGGEGGGRRVASAGDRHRAFTLIEVMIAMAIFFMAIFAILALVSTNLRNARRLQDKPLDASPIIAMSWQTNDIQEGSGSVDLGSLFPGYTCESNCVERTDFPTNGLYQVDYVVRGPTVGHNRSESHMTVLRWNPNPPALSTPGGK